MNCSIATADRATHLKIVTLALFWSTVVVAIAMLVR